MQVCLRFRMAIEQNNKCCTQDCQFTTAAIAGMLTAQERLLDRTINVALRTASLQQQLLAGKLIVQKRLLDRTINVALRTGSLQQQLYAGMLTVQEKLLDRTINVTLRTASLQQQLLASKLIVQERLLDRTINVALGTVSLQQQLFAGILWLIGHYCHAPNWFPTLSALQDTRPLRTTWQYSDLIEVVYVYSSGKVIGQNNKCCTQDCQFTTAAICR